jgi:hypothetical protein
MFDATPKLFAATAQTGFQASWCQSTNPTIKVLETHGLLDLRRLPIWTSAKLTVVAVSKRCTRADQGRIPLFKPE